MGDDPDEIQWPDEKELARQRHAKFYRPFTRPGEILVPGGRGYNPNGNLSFYYIRPRVLRGKPGGKKVFRMNDSENGLSCVGTPRPYALRRFHSSYGIAYGKEMTRVLNHLGIGQRMTRHFWIWEATVTRIA